MLELSRLDERSYSGRQEVVADLKIAEVVARQYVADQVNGTLPIASCERY